MDQAARDDAPTGATRIEAQRRLVDVGREVIEVQPRDAVVLLIARPTDSRCESKKDLITSR